MRNLDEALEFYGKTLGYESEQRDEDKNVFAYLFKSGDKLRSSLRLLPEDKLGERPMWMSFVSVENIADTLRKAEEIGGVVVWGPDPEVFQGRIAIVEDPAGASIIVVEEKKEGM